MKSLARKDAKYNILIIMTRKKNKTNTKTKTQTKTNTLKKDKSHFEAPNSPKSGLLPPEMVIIWPKLTRYNPE